MSLEIAILLAALVAGADGAASNPEVPLAVVFPGTLAQTRIIDKVAVTPGLYTVTSRVTHVYKGDVSLLDKTFQTVLMEGAHEAHFVFWPALKTGDEIISVVVPQNKELDYVPIWIVTSLSPNEAPGSYVKAHGEAQFNEALVFAKAIEETARAKPADRFNIVKAHARGTSRTEVAWALGVITKVDDVGSPAFLRGMIADPKLGAWQKIFADRTLEWLPDERWKESPERLRFYRSLARGPLTDADFRELYSAIGRMLWQEDFPKPDLAELVRAIAGRKDAPSSIREKAASEWNDVERERADSSRASEAQRKGQ